MSSAFSRLTPEIVNVLRHGGMTDSDHSLFVWHSDYEIAKLLGVSRSEVKRIAGDSVERSPAVKIKRRFRLLNDEHVKYLTSSETLKSWMPHSLRTRCKLFHRQFPDKLISFSRLRSLYREHGISHRVLQSGMLLQPN